MRRGSARAGRGRPPDLASAGRRRAPRAPDRAGTGRVALARRTAGRAARRRAPGASPPEDVGHQGLGREAGVGAEGERSPVSRRRHALDEALQERAHDVRRLLRAEGACPGAEQQTGQEREGQRVAVGELQDGRVLRLRQATRVQIGAAVVGQQIAQRQHPHDLAPGGVDPPGRRGWRPARPRRPGPGRGVGAGTARGSQVSSGASCLVGVDEQDEPLPDWRAPRAGDASWGRSSAAAAHRGSPGDGWRSRPSREATTAPAAAARRPNWRRSTLLPTPPGPWTNNRATGRSAASRSSRGTEDVELGRPADEVLVAQRAEAVGQVARGIVVLDSRLPPRPPQCTDRGARLLRLMTPARPPRPPCTPTAPACPSSARSKSLDELDQVARQRPLPGPGRATRTPSASGRNSRGRCRGSARAEANRQTNFRSCAWLPQRGDAVAEQLAQPRLGAPQQRRRPARRAAEVLPGSRGKLADPPLGVQFASPIVPPGPGRRAAPRAGRAPGPGRT